MYWVSVLICLNVLTVEGEKCIDSGDYSNLYKLIGDQTTLISSQNSKIAQLENAVKRIGVTFVIWGSKKCPNFATKVYDGFAGGSSYNDKGAAAEYLCLPSDPIYSKNKNEAVEGYAKLMGGEYQDVPYQNARDHDVPCVLCRAPSFANSLMIPGRNKCYEGWTVAYSGDLISGRNTHNAASQYVCHVAEPEIVGETHENHNGKLFYSVKSVCGSLPCPPYEDNKLVSCVVCLK